MHKPSLDSNYSRNQRYAAIGEKYSALLGPALERFDIEILPVPVNPYVDARLSYHADLSIFYDGGSEVFLTPFLEKTDFPLLIEKTGLKCTFPPIIQGDKYPKDVSLNICAFGEYFIYNPQTASADVIDWLEGQGRRGIRCRQGYCKCSVAVINNTSIISADKSICRLCRDMGLNVLEITPGYIDLEGYDYGFIGGSVFRISSDIIGFTGHIDHHPDKDRIEAFLADCGVSPVYLTDKPLFDIGSAILLHEK